MHPTNDDLIKLPRKAVVAFAAYCATMVRNILLSQNYLPLGSSRDTNAEFKDIELLEQYAATSGSLNKGNAAKLASKFRERADDYGKTDDKMSIKNKYWSVMADVARAIANAADTVSAIDASSAANAAIKAANIACRHTNLEDILEINHAYELLSHLSQQENWTDETPVLALLTLYSRKDTPSQLIKVIKTVNSEMIKYIKAHPKELYHLHWRAFEELVAELLSAHGWEVQLTQPSKDNGYDIFGIYKDESGTKHAWIIECKKWAQEKRIGVNIARALYSVKNDVRVGGAMLATTSHFTRGVEEYKASRYDFELRDYEGILEWINTYRPHPGGRLYLKNNKLSLPSDKKL